MTSAGMSVAEPQREYAGFQQRFVALVVDSVILGTVSLLLSLALGPGQAALPDFVIAFTYDVLGNGWGGTPGKRLLGMRLVNADGEAPGLASSLVRTVVAGVSFVALLLGFFWMLWDRDKQTWHDKAAGTYVVVA